MSAYLSLTPASPRRRPRLFFRNSFSISGSRTRALSSAASSRLSPTDGSAERASRTQWASVDSLTPSDAATSA